ncbi:AlbA family DNA-binding domain-containing protein [Desulfogranum mediterraneum]|uniref:AlbA family DNA-binding domain-containing protein n=1 Tax=Desulfogranum mediterraneum TaxID=160661 RepID=UPI0004127D6E|nr:ATP-binding protein [Desulfogranum mediterraneum]
MKFFRKILPFFIPVAGFLLVLTAINILQYYQLKKDLSTTLIQGISASEFKEIQSFFDSTISKLNIVRDWGQNGLLDLANPKDLNKKFMPLLEHQPHISALFLATDQGREYFLQQEQPRLISRASQQLNSTTVQEYQEWDGPETAVRSWQKHGSYDPRSRPWFTASPGKDQVYFTDIYTFNHSNSQGFSASVSWQQQGRLQVFGFDIQLADIRQLLHAVNRDKPSLLFLVNPGSHFHIAELPEQWPASIRTPLSGRQQLLPSIIGRWAEQGSPVATPITLKLKSEQWITSFQPLNQERQAFWIGVASTEGALIGALNNSLFRIDLLDMSVALTAGVVLFLLLWQIGLLHLSEPLPPSAGERFQQALAKGEGACVEFKSTIRANLKTGKPGKEIELAWLKALTAFLNSAGGTLLLGVDDAGTPVGLAVDGFESEDRCLLHIKNLINQHIGAEFSAFISLAMVDCGQTRALMVETSPAGTPVVLRIGKSEEFYVRSGPSSVKLSPSQMIRFVLQHHQAKTR